MVPASIFTVITLFFLLGIRKTFFFFQMIQKGLIAPNHEDLKKLNHMLKNKKFYSFFPVIFKIVLFLKLQIYLKRSIRKESFISHVNFAIKRLSWYDIDADTMNKRIGKILDRYDSLLQSKIHIYGAPVSGPIINILRNVYYIQRYNPNLMQFSFFAAKDKLLTIIGQPFVNDEFEQYMLDSDVIESLEEYLDKGMSAFINHLVEIRPAA